MHVVKLTNLCHVFSPHSQKSELKTRVDYRERGGKGVTFEKKPHLVKWSIVPLDKMN